MTSKIYREEGAINTFRQSPHLKERGIMILPKMGGVRVVTTNSKKHLMG